LPATARPIRTAVAKHSTEDFFKSALGELGYPLTTPPPFVPVVVTSYDS
jgi:hypothetical protein